MADSNIPLNLGSGGPLAASYQDVGGLHHSKAVLETQSGAADPLKVNASNPLPVAFVTAQAVVGDTVAGATDGGLAGLKISAVFNSVLPTYTTGQRADLQCDLNGRLLVNVAAGGGSGGTSSTFGVGFPGTGTAVGVMNLAGTAMIGLKADSGNNLMVNVAAGSVQAVTDNTPFTAGTTQGMAPAFVYNDALGALTSGNVGVARITKDRKLRVTLDPTDAGGLTPYSALSAATSTNLHTVKASPGQVYGIVAGNTNASARYLKLYDKAANPVLGTDTPVYRLLIPGNAAGAGAVIGFPQGLNFAAGIAHALTGGAADSDTTQTGANEVAFNLVYA